MDQILEQKTIDKETLKLSVDDIRIDCFERLLSSKPDLRVLLKLKDLASLLQIPDYTNEDEVICLVDQKLKTTKLCTDYSVKRDVDTDELNVVLQLFEVDESATQFLQLLNRCLKFANKDFEVYKPTGEDNICNHLTDEFKEYGQLIVDISKGLTDTIASDYSGLTCVQDIVQLHVELLNMFEGSWSGSRDMRADAIKQTFRDCMYVADLFSDNRIKIE